LRDSLYAAAYNGIKVFEYDEMTPYELSVYIEAQADKRKQEEEQAISIAYIQSRWTIQWLGKPKDHPEPLHKILNRPAEVKKEQTPEEMLAVLKTLNAALGGDVIE